MPTKRTGKTGSIRRAFESLSENFSLLFMFMAMIGLIVSLVIFRMKGVELDYQFVDREKIKKEVMLVNKELKARKAELLSIKNLKDFARKYGLKVPSKQQIIVIP